MLYELIEQGETIVVDTDCIDYGVVWDCLRLKPKERSAANKIIGLFNSADFFDNILIVDAHSWMKPYNRESQRHEIDHYKTRNEIEIAAKNDKAVQRLIDEGVLELHRKWHFLKKIRKDGNATIITSEQERHSQASYRLNVGLLYDLESAPY
ncbi:MAG TPA: hypothetical protein VJB11_02475 [archaeon]|nr:hypothetical protein [archaeon]